MIYGNQKYNYLNTIKAEQLMVGKELLVSTSNSFGTPTIDQHFRESKLSAFITSFLKQSDGISIAFYFKGHAVAIMEFPD